MIKKTITYENYNGETVKREFRFNLNKAELAELEFSEGGSLSKKIEAVTESGDEGEILRIFKKIILTAYGVKSEDGERFVKSADLTMAFEQSEAYVELFMELATDADAASKFISGIMPKMPTGPSELPPPLKHK